MLALAFLGGAAITCRAQTKLYLKDGTYVIVKSYQVKGDRVRYYSIADSQWEEMPVSLVDFAATRRAETTESAERRRVLEEAEKNAKDTYRMPPNTGFQIAAGIRLPSQEGLYAYDGVRVIPLIQSPEMLVPDKKRRALAMALPGPFLKTRSILIVPGKAAAIRILSSEPVFYAQLAGGGRLMLLHLKSGKVNRQVEKIEPGSHGAVEQSRDTVPLDISQINPGLFKIRPAHPLAPGEYALAPAGQSPLNPDVWDFGIDSPNPEPPRKRLIPLHP